jgi:hypothetical protein
MSNSANDYQKKIHIIGRITGTVFALSTLLLPLALWLQFDLLPTKEGFTKGIGIVLSLTIPALVAEFLSYAPIIGVGAYYAMISSGNYSNIRIPSTLVALDVTETDVSSEEGEILSTIAVTTSVITTEIILLAGVLLLVPFTDLFTNPILTPGFQQIVPGLFAALLVSFALKSIKISIVPIAIAVAIVLSNLISFTFLIPTVILVSVIAARILYKKGFYTPKAS